VYFTPSQVLDEASPVGHLAIKVRDNAAYLGLNGDLIIMAILVQEGHQHQMKTHHHIMVNVFELSLNRSHVFQYLSNLTPICADFDQVLREVNYVALRI
jgi:hypothetical protein